MTAFPVTSSTLSAKELGLFIIEKYNLNKNGSCELFRTGINHTYFITENEIKYVARVYSYKWRSKSEILAEINVLNVLKEHAINISYPIADKKGEYIQEINAPEGTRYLVLFSFAEGNKVRFINNETCFSIGSIMASIHTKMFDKEINRIHYNLETLLELPYEYAKPFFSETLEEMKFIKKQSIEIKDYFDLNELKNIPKGVVHMDIWYDNMSITTQNEVTIFDFDFCGNGYLIFDVAYFCKQLFHIETDKKEYESKMKSFLNGYESIRKLTKEEMLLIPKAGAAIWIFYLGVQSQRFDWSNIFLSENYLKMYIGKMKSWIEYHES
ncbi:aminoglycoside phosphotransferase [Flavobacterium sp. 316]|uniref:Phosphotransferase n=1 Tax=Flavobacterium sediminilitoris TaxID=2024526 RepID=A0ABY4HMJ2_9FLAO|nr:MULTISPECIES: phosphotransferase [Flavobacterium]KIX20079.1 aminoglycoside phosphotransferase [Flavobacterium sp. 316]UOX32679.1 phosphotransferase [Flavobacterium sediminilitoris]